MIKYHHMLVTAALRLIGTLNIYNWSPEEILESSLDPLGGSLHSLGHSLDSLGVSLDPLEDKRLC